MSQKLAVIFPGIGYTCDKPLLHYTRRILTEAGYDVILLKYKKKFFEDGYVTEEGIVKAYRKCSKKLKGIPLKEYEDIIFVGKSVGTLLEFMIGQDYEKGKKGISNIRYIAFSPLKQSFPYMANQEVIAFSGTNDPMVKVERLTELKQQYDVNLQLFEGGNHSLEVRNAPEKSVEILSQIITQVKAFIK